MAVDLLPGNLLAGDEPFNDEQYIECLLDNDLSGEEMADTEQYAEDAPGGEQSSGNMPDDEQSDKAKSRLKDPKFMKYLASMYHDAIPLPEMALTDNPCNTLLQISKRVHEYCQELDSEQDQTVIEKVKQLHKQYIELAGQQMSLGEREIMREEVWDACNEAEENQAPGPDGLPVELYLYCDEAREILYQLANHILTDPLSLTLEFTAGYITVQYKGTGNARELANYQSISLQNSSATIIADIIARHI
ncbi:hypothetical protein LPJ78_005485 [Coemansia sp. RSA 989]|nr:hypothetical protein LPJ78_005485 [Coemansia sp. RSA 989]